MLVCNGAIEASGKREERRFALRPIGNKILISIQHSAIQIRNGRRQCGTRWKQRYAGRERSGGVRKDCPYEALRVIYPRERGEVWAFTVGEGVLEDEKRAANPEGRQAYHLSGTVTTMLKSGRQIALPAT